MSTTLPPNAAKIKERIATILWPCDPGTADSISSATWWCFIFTCPVSDNRTTAMTLTMTTTTIYLNVVVTYVFLRDIGNLFTVWEKSVFNIILFELHRLTGHNVTTFHTSRITRSYRKTVLRRKNRLTKCLRNRI